MDSGITEKPLGVFWSDAIGRWALYGLAFLLPLWVLPITSAPILTNKVFLAFALILVSLIAWLVGRMQAGSAAIPKNLLALSLFLFAAAAVLSGIFSESSHVSFRILSGDPGGVIAIGFFVVAAFLAAAYFNSEERVFRWLVLFFASALILFAFQAAKTVFSLNPVPSWIDLPFASSNLFGTWIEFGILMSVAGFASLFLFEVVPFKNFRIFLALVVAASLAAAVAINSRVIWWTLFVFLVALFAYLFSVRLLGRRFFRPTLFLLLIVLFSLQAPTIMSLAAAYFGTQPVEVRPSFLATWETVQETLRTRPAVGSGPGTFLYDWVRFRPLEVNQSSFWDVRFTSGSGFLISFAAAAGGLGAAALLFVVAAFLWCGFKVFAGAGRGKPNSFLALLFFVVLMLLMYAALYNPGFVLTLYLFIFIGMFMGLFASHEFAGEYSVKLFANSGISFISALFIIAVLAGSISFGYILVQDYVAAYHYGKGVLAFNRAGDASGAAGAISRAIDLNATDIYWRGFADVKLAEFPRILAGGDAPDLLQSRFQAAASEAINAAQNATRANPIDSENWKTLARIYEALIPLNISGVADAALSAYGEEARRNPLSPEPILAQARIFAQAGDVQKARERAEAALSLKSNYVPAHLFVAQLEEQAGNIEKAIERLRAAALLNPTEVGTLFQLGLLYYRDGRFQSARQIFERAVELSPTYSNARYFLGLTYDRMGERNAALEQFRRVLVFNPDNEEVGRIIKNLESGRKALSGISSSPEDRSEAPVGE